MVITEPVIKPLNESYIPDVVKIHRAVLGYTFNSSLGDEHLTFLYRNLSNEATNFTSVALISNQPVGVISGSTDVEFTKSRLLKGYPISLWRNLITILLKNPGLVKNLWNNIIERPVYFENRLVSATLTTIAISPQFQGQGVGTNLVYALEEFFMSQNLDYYLVDTQLNNIRARFFYERLHFQEIARKANTIFFIKKLKR